MYSILRNGKCAKARPDLKNPSSNSLDVLCQARICETSDQSISQTCFISMQLLSFFLFNLLYFLTRSCSLKFARLAEDNISRRLSSLSFRWKLYKYLKAESITSLSPFEADASGVITYAPVLPLVAPLFVYVCGCVWVSWRACISVCVDPALDHSFTVERASTFQMCLLAPSAASVLDAAARSSHTIKNVMNKTKRV